jgi:hypothetical protein
LEAKTAEMYEFCRSETMTNMWVEGGGEVPPEKGGRRPLCISLAFTATPETEELESFIIKRPLD